MAKSAGITARSAAYRGLLLMLALALTLGIGLLGSATTVPKIATWYAALEKPAFTPPNWLFGPVWTALYVLMAIAAWRVWLAETQRLPQRRALFAFAVQLALNALWSQVFFRLESPRLALAVILGLLAALAWTLREFWRTDRMAALLLLPYFAWTTFAAVLNASIVALN
jgi:benzodiazapine receptor